MHVSCPVENRERSLLLGHKVDHKHIFQYRLQDLAELLVIGVNEVRVAIRGAGKREDPAMREALVQFFLADVGAPLQRLDLGNLVLQVGKGRLDSLDIFRLGRALEFERDDVLDFFDGDSRQ